MRISNNEVSRVLIKVFPLLIAAVLASGLVFALNAGVAVQSCNAEDDAAQGSFSGACDAAYPSACGPTGDLLSCDDGNVETHGMTSTGWAGINISIFNSSVTDCQSIGEVQLCFEFWTVSAAGPVNCNMSVDNQGGTNFTNVTGVCPDQGTANPGATCINITNAKKWKCSNFYGASGNRTLLRSEMLRSSGAAVKQISWDVFFFNNSYIPVDNTPPVVNTTFNITSPNINVCA